MSHSFRKTPISGITICESEKKDKRIWHKRMRATFRGLLSHLDPEDTPVVHHNQVSDPWGMGKDGKQWWDPRTWPKLMRK